MQTLATECNNRNIKFDSENNDFVNELLNINLGTCISKIEENNEHFINLLSKLWNDVKLQIYFNLK